MHDTPTRRRRGPSGLAEAPYRHHVILRIQGTAEQIHARFPPASQPWRSLRLRQAQIRRPSWLCVELRAERLDRLPG
jgi:hypothetical protein